MSSGQSPRPGAAVLVPATSSRVLVSQPLCGHGQRGLPSGTVFQYGVPFSRVTFLPRSRRKDKENSYLLRAYYLATTLLDASVTPFSPKQSLPRVGRVT